MDSDGMANQAKSFEYGASAYERFRPEFPAQLFDDIYDLAGERLRGRVLEVGAGTGRATLPFARRGTRVEVVEPSAEMLSILADRLAAESVEDLCALRQATYEDIDAAAPCDVLIAAQSFHWADPESRWSRLTSLLRGDGRAYMFWNGWCLSASSHNVDAVRRLYTEVGRGLASDVDDNRSKVGWAISEVDAEPGLRLIDSRRYAWTLTLPVDDYFALLTTTSQYAVASSEAVKALLTPLRTVLGDQVTLDGTTRLIEVGVTN